jgi:hypothetical protein
MRVRKRLASLELRGCGIGDDGGALGLDSTAAETVLVPP